MISSATARCGHCSSEHPVNIYESINVAETPELKESVLDGSLFVWECPSCGRRNLARFKCLYHDPGMKLMVWLTIGDSVLEEQARALGARLSGYTCRFVDDAGSLIEKVKIADAGLDDVAMEICKFVTASELKIDPSELKFFRADGADGDITLSYPKNGQMEMVAVGVDTYEDSCGILRRNPTIKEKATGFVKVDARWLSMFIG